MTWLPSFVPSDSETIYLVLDDFGDRGQAYREADTQGSDLESVLDGLMVGEYRNPVRIVAFNTAAQWSRDVSADIAREIQRRCDLQFSDVPSPAQAFVDRHADRQQLNLRLV